MLKFVKIHTLYRANAHGKTLQTLTQSLAIYRLHHFTSKSNLGYNALDSPLSLPQRVDENRVGIFWDLDNKPPKSYPPFDAAVRLIKAAKEFGIVAYKIAYANRHAFSYVPSEIREKRRERRRLNQLENSGVVKVFVPYVCKVCGRRFYNNDKLVNHFKQIHEREQMKRLNQIESARGSRRVRLVGKYSMKMEKYRNAARDVLTPKVGYGLADELKRGGFWVRAVSDKPQAADVALRNHMVDMMDHRRIGCVVLVSDDSDFVGILKEAKLRCLKTVVVGDANDGALKRVADASFSWQEIMMGKAKKEAGSVVGRWKDRDVLKRLEWTYDPERDGEHYNSEIESDLESEDSDIEGFLSEEDDALMQKEDTGTWWELKSETVDVKSPARSLKQ